MSRRDIENTQNLIYRLQKNDVLVIHSNYICIIFFQYLHNYAIK